VIVFVHRLDDFSDLVYGLAHTEYHFRKTLANRAMVINVGESQILEGKRTQTVQSFGGGDCSFFMLFEDLSDLIFSHTIEKRNLKLDESCISDPKS